MSRVEHISWNQFNESTDLKLQVETYRTTFGYYPELLLVDQIYTKRENIKWLKKKGIRIVGKPLGDLQKKSFTPTKNENLKKNEIKETSLMANSDKQIMLAD
jgi:hypothetical protein